MERFMNEKEPVASTPKTPLEIAEDREEFYGGGEPAASSPEAPKMSLDELIAAYEKALADSANAEFSASLSASVRSLKKRKARTEGPAASTPKTVPQTNGSRPFTSWSSIRWNTVGAVKTETQRLRELNAQMLEALKRVREISTHHPIAGRLRKIGLVCGEAIRNYEKNR
jgi:hypothetical protein